MPHLERARSMFPALKRELNGQKVTYFDGPAGSQVPQSVIDAVENYLSNSNANLGAVFITSRETDELLERTRQKLTEFLNVTNPLEIVFGPNMTSLTFSVAQAIAKTLKPGDEIIVTQLDHDANVTPWVLAAEAAGAVVNYVNINPDDCKLDQEQYRSLLSEKTKLVAVGAASNATGTLNPIKQMVADAKTVGALTYIDAVHYAPHQLIDVQEMGCDFLVCSGYKFFGPHVGVLWGRYDLLETLQPNKLRPAPDHPPGKWMTGTQNFEGIAGLEAAIEYLANLGSPLASTSLRNQLADSYERISSYEQRLSADFIEAMKELPDFKIWGITDKSQLHQRVPTFSLTHSRHTPQYISRQLAEVGIFSWSGNHYALPFTKAMQLEPHGTLRIGLLHYNTQSQIERLVKQLKRL